MRIFVLLLTAFSLMPVTVAQDSSPAAPSAALPTPQQPAATPPAAAPAQTAPASTPPQIAPPAAAASNQPVADANGRYTIRGSARLVVLDVVVLDAKGNPVTNLKKEDFAVTEAKDSQTLLNFEPSGARVINDASLVINSTADLDRLAPRAPVNIVLLDEFNTRFEDMAFARYSLKEFLKRQPDKLNLPTMLVAVNLQKFTVLQDYTQDKQALISALDHHFVAYPWQTHQYTWVAERFGAAFSALMQVAQATVGHQGHKNMIWIGRGFPNINFANQPVDNERRVNNFVQVCVNALRDARVTLYAIDPAGLMIDPGKYGSDAAFNDPFGGNYTFSKLAVATGGKALYGRNDVDAEIGTSIRDGSSFYTLTYRPTNSSLDPQKFRKIVVTLNDRPDLKATTRQGYYLQGGPARVDPANPSKRLAFDLVNAEKSNITYDGVPITATVSATDPLAFRIHVDARALGWTPATDTERRTAEVILMASTFDKKGKELKRIAKNIKASAPSDVPPTGRLERALDMDLKLDPDPKAVRARFVVRVAVSGRIGTADVPLNSAMTAAK